MVKQIVTTDKNILSYSEKRELLRILRAQLTTKEQVMLFYNWYSGCGKQWEKFNKKKKNDENYFFTDYRMLHNIDPKDLIFLNDKNNNKDKMDSFKKIFFNKCSKIFDEIQFDEGKDIKTDPLFQLESICLNEDVENAKEKLLANNPWIIKKIFQKIKLIVKRLWERRFRDFLQLNVK